MDDGGRVKEMMERRQELLKELRVKLVDELG